MCRSSSRSVVPGTQRAAVISLVLLAAVMPPQLACAEQETDCAKIKVSSKRLACFDAQQKIQMELAEANRKQQLIEEEDRKRQKERDTYQSATRPVMIALQRLKSRVEVGVSYRDYSAPLADADYEIKRFLKSPVAGQRSEFDKAITNALRIYFRAGLEWNTAVRFAGKLINDEIIVGADLLDQFPELSLDAKRGWEGKMFISYKKLLSILWEAAGRQVDMAEEAVNMKHPMLTE